MTTIYREIPCLVKLGPQGDAKEDVFRFVGSTEAQDRGGDIIETAGWQFDNYLKNPVVLWGHDRRNLPPIGKVVGVTKDLDKKQVVFDVVFAEEKDFPFAGTIKKLVKSGFINAVSVGAIVKKSDDLKREELPEHLRDQGFFFSNPPARIKELEMVELSIVPVPANRDTLRVLNAVENKELVLKSFHAYQDLLEPEALTDKQAPTVLLPQLDAQLKEFVETLKTTFKTHTEAVQQLNATVKELSHLVELTSEGIDPSAPGTPKPEGEMTEDAMKQISGEIKQLVESFKF